jgi:hypothetical protein
VPGNSTTFLFEAFHCLQRRKRVVQRKMNAREHPIAIPAFAPAEREDLVAGTGEVEVEVVDWALLGLDVLCELVVVDMVVPLLVVVLDEGVGVAFEEVVPTLVLLVVSALELELGVEGFERVLVVLGLLITGAWVCVGFEGETDDVDAADGPCILKTKP